MRLKIKKFKKRNRNVPRQYREPLSEYREYVPLGLELAAVAAFWYEALFDYEWRSMAYPKALHSTSVFYEKRIDKIRRLIGDDEVEHARADVEEHWKARMPTMWRILRGGTNEERELVQWLGQQIQGHPVDGQPDLEGGPMFCLEAVVKSAIELGMRVPDSNKSDAEEKGGAAE